MTKDEIIKLAESVGINFQEHIGVLGRSNITTLGSQPIGKIEAFARACYEAGKAEFAKGAKVTIPPHAMEQEFQLHYRKGYEAGRTAERSACEKDAGEFARKWWGIHCASNKHMETTRKAHDDFCSLQNAIRARGKP